MLMNSQDKQKQFLREVLRLKSMVSRACLPVGRPKARDFLAEVLVKITAGNF